MDLTSPKTVKAIFSKYEARPSKGLGQNFLIDKNVLEKIVESADMKPDDAILEVGPGVGTLTQALAEKASKVIAVEKDKTMCEILKNVLAVQGVKNVQIVNADILKTNISSFKLQASRYKVVANIPYYLTSPLIRKFLESKNPPSDMILMLQKEVAQRICAKPPSMSLLAISVQFYAEPKIISYVSKNCFWPAPKVDSATIKITPSPELGEVHSARDSADFFAVVKAGFSQPRKQLVGNLSKSLKLDRERTEDWLKKNNIKPTQRAETLSVDDWKKLTASNPKTID